MVNFSLRVNFVPQVNLRLSLKLTIDQRSGLTIDKMNGEFRSTGQFCSAIEFQTESKIDH